MIVVIIIRCISAYCVGTTRKSQLFQPHFFLITTNDCETPIGTRACRYLGNYIVGNSDHS